MSNSPPFGLSEHIVMIADIGEKKNEEQKGKSSCGKK